MGQKNPVWFQRLQVSAGGDQQAQTGEAAFRCDGQLVCSPKRSKLSRIMAGDIAPWIPRALIFASFVFSAVAIAITFYESLHDGYNH
jgi:hypothetical protein